MAEGLHRISDRYGIPDEDDLVDYFTHRGGRDIRLLRSLAKGFRHFWNGDYESCIYLITPRLETAARSLLLELDEGIYRVEAGKMTCMRDPLSSAHAWCVRVSIQEREEVSLCLS
jgi:hypothetical protein